MAAIGPMREWPWLAGALLTCGCWMLAMPAQAQVTGPDGQSSTINSVEDEIENYQIIVIGSRTIVAALQDFEVEQTYDEDIVESYGVSTLGELLDQIRQENGDQQPSLLVNGKPVRDIGDIANLPVEALKRIEALPRGSAQRIGGSAGQRAYNVVLRPSYKRVTVTLGQELATEGGWRRTKAELLFNYIRKQDRLSLTLRHAESDMLFESERDLILLPEPFPYSPFGNVLPFGTEEIDPALSAAAGLPVTVVALNGIAGPGLADLLAGANRTNASQADRYRSLRNRSTTKEIALAGNKELSSWLSVSINGRLNWTNTESLRGLPSGRFLIPANNAFTPFANPVLVALNDPLRPLENNSETSARSLSATFNATLETWQMTLLMRYDERRSGYTSELNGNFTGGFLIVDPATNPFTGELAQLIPVLTRVSKSRNIDRQIALDAQGPLVKLPTGMMQGRIGAGALWTSFSAFDSVRSRGFERQELTVKAGVTVPLTGEQFLPDLGASEVSLDVGRLDLGSVGTIDRYALGVNWNPVKGLRFSAGQTKDGTAIYPELLAAPIVLTENVPYFDPLRNETVDVLLTIGGGGNLRNQTQRTRTLSVTASPVKKYDLQLSAEYQELNIRNLLGALPLPSSAVVAAFPDRFVRDGSGKLVAVDTRTVNFARQDTRQLRLGLNAGIELRPPRTIAKTANRPGQRIPATQLQVSVSHTVVLDSTTVIRPGLPEIDLLTGGAIGISGGQQRHLTNAAIALTQGTTGARLNANWRGRSYLQTGSAIDPDRLTFGTLSTIDLRLFADLSKVFPKVKIAKGARVTLVVDNITNHRQIVTNSSDKVPLSYQAIYRDPIGRTLMLELRKAI